MGNRIIRCVFFLLISIFSVKYCSGQVIFDQTDCKNPSRGIPYGQPKKMYEYYYLEMSDDINAKAVLVTSSEYEFQSDGRLSTFYKSTNTNNKKSTRKTMSTAGFILEYHPDGRLKKAIEKDEEKNYYRTTDYSYPDEHTIISHLKHSADERLNFKTTITIKDCKIDKSETTNQKGQLIRKSIVKSDGTTEAIDYLKGEKVTTNEAEQVIKRDDQGNCIESTIERSDLGGAQLHVFRHYIYDTPTKNSETIEDLGNIVFEAIQSENYSRILSKTMNTVDYMEMYARSPYKPLNKVRASALSENEDAKMRLDAWVKNIRERSFQNWEEVKLDEVVIDQNIEGTLSTDKRTFEITLKVSNKTKSKLITFEIISLSTGWQIWL